VGGVGIPGATDLIVLGLSGGAEVVEKEASDYLGVSGAVCSLLLLNKLLFFTTLTLCLLSFQFGSAIKDFNVQLLNPKEVPYLLTQTLHSTICMCVRSTCMYVCYCGNNLLLFIKFGGELVILAYRVV